MAEKKNPKAKAKAKAKEQTVDPPPFELCEVCNLNHNDGRRHKYFPSHARAVSALLSRFSTKLADLRFFLRNPSPLRPEHAARNRLWCVFCALDLTEIGSAFACSNAICHLVGEEHLKNLKEFLRKHGGGMDRVNAFRVSEADLIKWEKGCTLLKNAVSSSSQGPIGPVPRPSKDIQYEITSNNMDSFENSNINYFNSNASHAVMPLQTLTTERYRICHQEVNGGAIAGTKPDFASSLLMDMRGNMGFHSMHTIRSGASNSTSTKPMQPDNNGRTFGWSLSSQTEGQNHSKEDCTRGLQKLSQIPSTPEGRQANVHTGAPPPWLQANEIEKDLVTEGPHINDVTANSAQTRKLRKLNPKRVGAAWADKRRAELEMEKRGELVPSSVDVNWLPNFGRVWQAGSRKESKKEFETEKRKLLEDNHSQSSFKLQPYISKRMRIGSPTKMGL